MRPKFYERFAFTGECRLVAAIHAAGALARLHICGNTRRILAGMGWTGADIIDLDFPGESPGECGRRRAQSTASKSWMEVCART